ncbi:MAG: hypothetical protein LBS35_13200 [Synergistaceae bacterium]|jgi:hypothetical protein|nr:hypothetical protein [Synergistaceae bacterium]
MDIPENPFHRINARAHHNRVKLMDLADTQGLVGDPDDTARALSDLTNPRKRIAAEVAWFPGVSATHVDALLSMLKTPPILLSSAKNLPQPGMARANLLAAGLRRLDAEDRTPSSVAVWIMEISTSFECAEPDTLMLLINDDRVVSGFPEITDISAVRGEINERRRYFRSVIMAALGSMRESDRLEAIMKVVRSSTGDGTKLAPAVVFDMVDLYEVESKAPLARQEQKLQFLIARVRDAAEQNQSDADIANLIGGLVTDFRAWRHVVEPTHICARVRGLKSTRDALLGAAAELESMLSALGRRNLAETLSESLKKVFADDWELSYEPEKTEKIQAAGGESPEAARETPAAARDDAGELIFETDVEIISREKLRISSEFIEWQGRRWNVGSITRMRWGRIPDEGSDTHSVITYRVFWGDEVGWASMDFVNGRLYEKIVRGLWKAVGLKLLRGILAGLRDGNSYRFGMITANDRGIELERHDGAEGGRVFCAWTDVVIMDQAGAFCIGKSDDSRLWVEFRYLEEDNINLLENAVRIREKHGTPRLSGLLQG